MLTGYMPSEQAPELDSGGFRLMNWNMMKNRQDGWEKDFLLHSQKSDLLIMQEAYLTGDLRKLLETGQYSWDLSIAYTFMTTEAGVLTASNIKPDFLCTVRSEEPLIRTPKMILITRYPLSRSDLSLLVVNIHSINFTIDTAGFSAQLRQLEPLVSHHQGPVIIAGDFNTWSNERIAIVENLIRKHNLREVMFNTDNRATFFGHRVDHIYFRGLDYDDAKVSSVGTSDHNPMMVTFRLTDDQFVGR